MYYFCTKVVERYKAENVSHLGITDPFENLSSYEGSHSKIMPPSSMSSEPQVHIRASDLIRTMLQFLLE